MHDEPCPMRRALLIVAAAVTLASALPARAGTSVVCEGTLPLEATCSKTFVAPGELVAIFCTSPAIGTVEGFAQGQPADHAYFFAIGAGVVGPCGAEWSEMRTGETITMAFAGAGSGYWRFELFFA